MDIDLTAARSFLATHRRILDRRRLELLLDGGSSAGVLAVLDGYRNRDGGYGWGLEPDLRSPESQPAAALHAFEVLAEAAPTITPRAVELCDWLGSNTRGVGALPFALEVSGTAGIAPWWAGADTATPSLPITAAVAANAHRVARHDPGVAEHPWLTDATRWCLGAIAALTRDAHAYELLFAVHFLDAVCDDEPEAAALLRHLGTLLPDDGVMPVAGGADGEAIRPLKLAPRADGAARRLFRRDLIAGELRRLADAQQDDGGWTVDFHTASPAAALEWRGYATVAAVTTILSDREVQPTSVT